MDVVAEARHEPLRGPLRGDDVEGDGVPAVVGGGALGGQVVVQEPAAVLGDAEEARPAPSSPAASAPCTESGADRWVSRVTIAVGVKPWSASAARTASNTRVCPGVGRRWVASQNASSPNPTVPITSSARSWPSRVMASFDEAPRAVG
ncbi:hypothetical protein WY02_04140 [Pseudonocardia sp. AL041005-10]|nr:hypothetical protein WY02_04140 [Pseudonocardia sp. AL041005-10]